MHWPTRGGPARSAAPASSGGQKAPQADDDKKDKDSDEGSGKFDPKNLERGAAALTEIDKSKHGAWAFEMAQLQENTRQLEFMRDCEVQLSQKAQLQEQAAAVQGEEMRRTISHNADQERATSQHKAQIDHTLQGNKLKLQQEVMEYKLAKDQEQFHQHESIRISNEAGIEEFVRQTMRLKAEHDREVAVSEARALAAGAAKQERENIEVRLRELRAKASEDRNTRLQSIETYFTGLTAGAQALQEDPSKMVTLVAGLSALALGVYSARAATRVASTVIEKNLSRPPLVRETSRWTWKPSTSWLSFLSKEKPNMFETIILEEELKERLRWTTNALLNAQMNGTPFRHLMLYGPPGTGKTLFARTLARQSGLDYAIMSGGDLGPLGAEGPNELHKLFGWAQRSKKGLVLFVDEADAFLRKGRGGDVAMSEDARNALSVFLHYTGTESARISVILATNVPSVLDRAVIDRIDEAFEFPKPAFEQRETMLQLFFKQYIHAKTKKGKSIMVEDSINDDFIKDMAKKTDGMSGRQLAKLVLAFQSAVFGSGSTKLTRALAETVLEWRLLNPNA